MSSQVLKREGVATHQAHAEMRTEKREPEGHGEALKMEVDEPQGTELRVVVKLHVPVTGSSHIV